MMYFSSKLRCQSIDTRSITSPIYEYKENHNLVHYNKASNNQKQTNKQTKSKSRQGQKKKKGKITFKGKMTTLTVNFSREIIKAIKQ